MENVLKVKGRVISVLALDAIISDLYAEYRGSTYKPCRVSGFPSAYIVHFAHENGSFAPDALNVILLITTGDGHYRATGLTRYDRGDGKPQLYLMGDDIKIQVETSADKSIRDIPNQMG